MDYVELHARSAFSFLHGASSPEELAAAASMASLRAMALCDRGGVYGSARFHFAAKDCGIRAITGCELEMQGGVWLPVLVATRAGYQNLCRLITEAKLRGTKASAPLRWGDLTGRTSGLIALTGDRCGPLAGRILSRDFAGAREHLRQLAALFEPDCVRVEVQRHHVRGGERLIDRLRELAGLEKIPCVATNGVCHATPDGRRLLDVFTCARHHTHLDAAGRLLSQNSERHIKSATEMSALFADWPEVISESVRIAGRLDFVLEDLGYEFPRFPVPGGETMETFLRTVTIEGARRRYGKIRPKVQKQLDHELELISRLGFSGYFLIVWDLANFCRDEGILMQGRGSAANSAVCYSLGITACDPVGYGLLFERFLSEGRKSWPDIDLDLPSGDRRERVIQEVYRRYGEHGAAMTANVISYRGRSAMREVGKALNFPAEFMDRFSKLYAGGDFPQTLELADQIEQAGIARSHPRFQAAIQLCNAISGLPRHLGQHSGGMIICRGALSSVVPLERATMPGRVVAQWDKDDCADLGLIKVDLLGLGMLSAMQDAIQICSERGRPVDLANLPQDDADTFAMIRKADTIGVFQIESRAQMATLPRMKPRTFYDLVVEVAIIRPGPIQGDMVHPFLARRAGDEPVTYFDERLKPVLERTLGVPLFQEQILRIAMIMANFTGSEAEELRRALSFHRSQERMERVCTKLRAGMERNSVAPEICDSIVKAVQSFAVYGFPESHAISFALIAYASAWMKVHRTAEFFVGLLNNQPMGFYSPSTLLQDAKAHGLRVRAVDVQTSAWECSVLEDQAIQLGLCMVRGIGTDEGARILQARNVQPFDSVADLQKRAELERTTMRKLARLGALNGLANHRRDALWKIEGLGVPGELPILESDETSATPLAPMSPVERLDADFHGMGLSTGPHPMALVRSQVPKAWMASELSEVRNGQTVELAGMVICRQRPGSAKGFFFVSLEDESGVANAIVSPALFEKRRLCVTREAFLSIRGVAQVKDGVVLVKARSVEALRVDAVATPSSHDFH